MENQLNIEVGATVVEFDGKVVTFSNGYTLELGKVKPPKRKPEKTVTVWAFTGMRIGDLEVVSETEEAVIVKKGDGKKMTFDKKTGLQTDCKKPRYANRLNPNVG